MSFRGLFKRVKAGQRPSAEQWNLLCNMVEQICSSLEIQGVYSPSLGFLAREKFGKPGLKIFWARAKESSPAHGYILCDILSPQGVGVMFEDVTVYVHGSEDLSADTPYINYGQRFPVMWTGEGTYWAMFIPEGVSSLKARMGL